MRSPHPERDWFVLANFVTGLVLHAPPRTSTRAPHHRAHQHPRGGYDPAAVRGHYGAGHPPLGPLQSPLVPPRTARSPTPPRPAGTRTPCRSSSWCTCPCLLGTLTVEHDGERFTRVLYFSTGEQARAGERDMPAAIRRRDVTALRLLVRPVEFLDLRDPWLQFPKTDSERSAQGDRMPPASPLNNQRTTLTAPFTTSTRSPPPPVDIARTRAGLVEPTAAPLRTLTCTVMSFVAPGARDMA